MKSTIRALLGKTLAWLVFFVLCNIDRTSAQDLDSLRQLVRQQHVPDTTRILALTDIAYQLYSTKSDSALRLATQADSLASVIGYSKGRGRAIRVMGIYHWTKGNYSKAVDLFKMALHFAERSGDLHGIANCYGNIGVAYRNEGNYEKALEYQLNALRIRQQIGGKQGIAANYNNIGLIYKEMGNYDKALEYFQYCLHLYLELNDQPGLGRTYGNIGTVYQEQKKYNEALPYQLNSLNIQEAINDERGLTFANANLADVYLSLGKKDKALAFLQRGLALATKIKANDRISNLKVIYAEYYNANGSWQEAFKSADEAQRLAASVGNLELNRDGFKQKYIAALQLGNYKEAIKNYEFFISLRDSVRNEKNNKRALSKEYEFREEKLKIEQEKSKIEHLAAQERQRWISYIFCTVSIILIAFSLFIYRSNRQIKMRNREIEAQKKYIEELNGILELKALNAQVKPHFIFNCLNSINLYIIREKPLDASTYLARFSRLIRLILEYSDEQKITLSQELECLELYLRMEQLRLNNRFAYYIHPAPELNPEVILVPPMILQPFVENSVWHGLYPKEGAGTISIEISRTDDNQLRYTIADDGVGRDHKGIKEKRISVQKSFGVKSSLQRLQLLYKEAAAQDRVQVIDLRSPSGEAHGTKVIITFPLQKIKKHLNDDSLKISA